MEPKLDYMRRMLETGLCLVCMAIVENNHNDRDFVKEKSNSVLGFSNMSAIAKTVDTIAHINRRVNRFVDEIKDRLPHDYSRRQRMHADNEHRDWLLRRNYLIERLYSAAAWKLEPYGADVAFFCGGGATTARSCIAIPPEKRSEITEEIAILAAEAQLIKTMFNASFCGSVSSMWLPIIASNKFNKLVFTENDANSPQDENIKTLQHTVGHVTETLNVDDFLTERGWRRDQVTIRRSSGSSYIARIWDVAAPKGKRIQSNCVLVDFADDLNQRVSVREPGAKRLDAQKPAATWYQYEFLYYPDGRPRKPKGKI